MPMSDDRFKDEPPPGRQTRHWRPLPSRDECVSAETILSFAAEYRKRFGVGNRPRNLESSVPSIAPDRIEEFEHFAPLSAEDAEPPEEA